MLLIRKRIGNLLKKPIVFVATVRLPSSLVTNHTAHPSSSMKQARLKQAIRRLLLTTLVVQGE